jgi:hypothetical protein
LASTTTMNSSSVRGSRSAMISVTGRPPRKLGVGKRRAEIEPARGGHVRGVAFVHGPIEPEPRRERLARLGGDVGLDEDRRDVARHHLEDEEDRGDDEERRTSALEQPVDDVADHRTSCTACVNPAGPPEVLFWMPPSPRWSGTGCGRSGTPRRWRVEEHDVGQVAGEELLQPERQPHGHAPCRRPRRGTPPRAGRIRGSRSPAALWPRRPV